MTIASDKLQEFYTNVLSKDAIIEEDDLDFKLLDAECKRLSFRYINV